MLVNVYFYTLVGITIGVLLGLSFPIEQPSHSTGSHSGLSVRLVVIVVLTSLVERIWEGYLSSNAVLIDITEVLVLKAVCAHRPLENCVVVVKKRCSHRNSIANVEAFPVYRR